MVPTNRVKISTLIQSCRVDKNGDLCFFTQKTPLTLSIISDFNLKTEADRGHMRHRQITRLAVDGVLTSVG